MHFTCRNQSMNITVCACSSLFCGLNLKYNFLDRQLIVLNPRIPFSEEITPYKTISFLAPPFKCQVSSSQLREPLAETPGTQQEKNFQTLVKQEQYFN